MFNHDSKFNYIKNLFTSKQCFEKYGKNSNINSKDNDTTNDNNKENKQNINDIDASELTFEIKLNPLKSYRYYPWKEFSEESICYPDAKPDKVKSFILNYTRKNMFIGLNSLMIYYKKARSIITDIRDKKREYNGFNDGTRYN